MGMAQGGRRSVTLGMVSPVHRVILTAKKQPLPDLGDVYQSCGSPSTGSIYGELRAGAKRVSRSHARMRLDQAAEHPEMVNAGREMLSPGTIPAADGSY
jgi:hypothetical protein